MDLGQKIEALRKKQHLTQSQLAETLDVSRQTVYKWEAGIVSPDIKKLKSLADLLHISVDELIDENVELTEEDRTEREHSSSRIIKQRSILDYLLLVPIILSVFILIFMFYCFGAMFIGFIGVAFIGSVMSPFYGILLIILNASQGFSHIVAAIAIMIFGISLVFPLYLLFIYWYKTYLRLAKKLTHKIKHFKWKKV